jgi:hypothetical protein
MTSETGSGLADSLEVASSSRLGRYRRNLPVLLTGLYASLAHAWPVRPELTWFALATLSVLVLLLSPLPERATTRLYLGVYGFFTIAIVESALFGGHGAVPVAFRAAGWAAYALALGALPHFEATAVSQALRPPHALASNGPLEPRRRASRAPLLALCLFTSGALALFLWPLPGLPPAKVMLFRSFAVLLGLGLIGLAAELGAEATTGFERRPTFAYLRALLSVGALALGVLTARSWARGHDFEAAAWGAGAGLVLGLALRFRKFPRTKIEL